ncbi:spore gernimation protein [Brevibacillus sp. SKDU10]|uniref:GerAB/ArcD/ProY family transporter n=1 Tax=Brevibacillus sp. SKDU10 TaxID=1247872 RepID=UPI0007C92CC9|nr:GerAB/ArcD/ProY family transporter [Brevibacillus sp. SKDU10]OAJ76243.1 spore gernimation protein [Brevibacillus sp. SKDU10]
MSLNFQPKFSGLDVSTFIASMVIGVSILTLPRVAVEAVGTADVWIDVLAGGILAMIAGYFCAKLSQQYPSYHFYRITQIIAGKWVSSLLILIYSLFYFFLCVYEARVQAEVIRHFLLDQTPIHMTIICFLLAGLYLVMGGAHPIVRLFLLYFPVTILILFSIVLLNYQSFQIENLLPVLKDGWMPLLHGMPATSPSYMAFEVIMFLTYMMKSPADSSKSVVIGLGFATLIYTTITVMVVGTLTAHEVKTLTWPTMEFVKQIEFPGAFFEHYELFFMVIWVFSIFTTFVFCFYLVSLGLSLLVPIRLPLLQVLLTPLLYAFAMVPQNLDQAFSLGTQLGYASIITSVVIPILLLLCSKWRKPVNAQQEKQT